MSEGRTVAVTGASGNIGSAVLRRLQDDPRCQKVVALARRPPSQGADAAKVTWLARDITEDDLVTAFGGCHVVIHLAWRIQPSWDLPALRRTNVEGSRRVFEAAASAGVSALVHASSIGAYVAGPKSPPVDETWPLGGYPGHPYSQQKAEVERLLDDVQRRHGDLRVARMRPCLVFQAAAGQEIRRYFLPRHTPGALLRPAVLARNPACFQVAHADDVAGAFVAAALSEASGAFNVATDDVIGSRPLPFLEKVIRPLVWASWRLHLQPVDPGWVRLVFHTPVIDAGRARRELGWQPRHSGHEAFAEGVAALADPPEPTTPALAG